MGPCGETVGPWSQKKGQIAAETGTRHANGFGSWWLLPPVNSPRLGPPLGTAPHCSLCEPCSFLSLCGHAPPPTPPHMHKGARTMDPRFFHWHGGKLGWPPTRRPPQLFQPRGARGWVGPLSPPHVLPRARLVHGWPPACPHPLPRGFCCCFLKSAQPSGL